MPASWFLVDSLTAVSAAIFLALALATYLASPRRDRELEQVSTLLCVTLGTLLAYCSASLWMFTFGWAITALPYLANSTSGTPRLALGTSTVFLALGAALSSFGGPAFHNIAFGLLVAAVLIRKGVFPFHSWVLRGFETTPLLPLGLLLNGHLGGFLLLRFAIPFYPEAARGTLPLLASLALLSSLYTALIALSQTAPLRILALLSLSQAAFILAGIESRNEVGIAGAIVHWSVVAVATTGLYIVYRAIEARFPAAATQSGYLGLVTHAPRLAAFFALCGVALVGLPGMLGFTAEDLLFHGSLESHPLLGILLPLATALNAITMYRLFSRLFLGRTANAAPAIADALPRERWALAAVVVFLVWFGLAPNALVNARIGTAERTAQLLEEVR